MPGTARAPFARFSPVMFGAFLLPLACVNPEQNPGASPGENTTDESTTSGQTVRGSVSGDSGPDATTSPTQTQSEGQHETSITTTSGELDSGDSETGVEASTDTTTGTDDPLCPGSETPVHCIEGFAGPYPCQRTSLLAHMSVEQLSGKATDVWGWTSKSGREYGLVATTAGLSVVEVSDPCAPELVGQLPTQATNSSHYDVKVVDDLALIVTERAAIGLQIFDLSQLDDITDRPQQLAELANYTGFGSAHNLATAAGSSTAYILGSNHCGGGLIAVGLDDPHNARELGCWSDSYTADAVCFTYRGPDVVYRNRTICITANGGRGSASILDVSDPSQITLLSEMNYPEPGFSNQGWVTDDHRHFVLGDLYEEDAEQPTRTLVFDITDLEAGEFDFAWRNPHETATAHNQYVRGDFVYQANYLGGLRILNLADIEDQRLTEVGYFDPTPDGSGQGLHGVWSVYPYFDSGVTLVTEKLGGLFILLPPPWSNDRPHSRNR